ncbi:signal peptidase I [Candidatus Pacearchaeota archaeon]|nr:signal peptidase I [Candidatus Pacearchaeota archaeon]
MKIIKISRICLIFLIGFLAANFVNYYMVYGLEAPFSKSINFLGYSSKDVPSDFITEDDIIIYDDKIVIKIDDASIGRYAPTGSMKPLLDQNSNGIRIIPKSEKDIHIGDIITFEDKGSLIIHRVIDKGTDSKGTYFITKGDNNEIADGRVRFKDIRYVTIGILW